MTILDTEFADVATQLPLHVINGAHEGPTLVVTAAIHGAEYVGVEAAQRLARDTDESVPFVVDELPPVMSRPPLAR